MYLYNLSYNRLLPDCHHFSISTNVLSSKILHRTNQNSVELLQTIKFSIGKMLFVSSWSCNTYGQQQIRSSLDQIMVCCFFGVKPLFFTNGGMLFESKFSLKKMHLNLLSENSGHFVSVSMCNSWNYPTSRQWCICFMGHAFLCSIGVSYNLILLISIRVTPLPLMLLQSYYGPNASEAKLNCIGI